MTTAATQVAPFKRSYRIGQIDTGYKTRANVTVDVEWTGERLSLSGTAERPHARDIDMGGQMQDTIAAMPLEDLRILGSERDRLLELWNRWHLNDMRAGCEHQRAEEWDKRPIDPTKPTDTYGRHFDGQTQDSWNLLGWVRPSEHPDGLMTKPCPECGYRYGTAWLTEEVPADVLNELKTWPFTRATA
jgi:hypothetical protein